MKKSILIAATVIIILSALATFFLMGRRDIVEGTIEMGLSFDQAAGTKLGFTITGMTLMGKDGRRYTLARSEKFKFVNKSSQPDNILSLGESGRYIAKGRIIPREQVIEKLEAAAGNSRYIQIPNHDVLVADILEKKL